jgi:cobalamin biosynthesis protein CobT
VLGKRAPFHDPRLFQKKRNPGKRSYAVVLGIDISGSTIGLNIALAKQAAYAQAELCNRLGIDFAVYAHSATPVGGTHILDMYAIKDFDSPWDTKSQKALLSIGSASENLDGHSLEFYRKMIERHPATDKIILYYSDGKMPAANYSEELTVLQREIETCRRKNITLLGVGIRTDSPTKHGLDTVQVDGPAEVGKVVRHLESRILHNR